MKNFLMLIACLLVCRVSFAQNPGKESNKVSDTSKVKKLKEVTIEAKLLSM
jgi:hypothetical protein